MKDGLEETPTISQWLSRTVHSSQCIVHSSGTSFTPLKGETEGAFKVAIDGWVNTMADVRSLMDELQKTNLKLDIGGDPADELWKNRPSIPTNPIEIQPIEYAGETCQSKIDRLREALQQAGAEGTIVSQLDEIAWLLNLRGTDVHCNPVFVAYVLLTQNEATLFTNPKRYCPY